MPTDTPPLPFAHCFEDPLQIDRDCDRDLAADEVGIDPFPAGADPGRPPELHPGGGPCGSPEAWLHGGRRGVDEPLTWTGLEFSTCCDTGTIMGTPNQVAKFGPMGNAVVDSRIADPGGSAAVTVGASMDVAGPVRILQTTPSAGRGLLSVTTGSLPNTVQLELVAARSGAGAFAGGLYLYADADAVRVNLVCTQTDRAYAINGVAGGTDSVAGFDFDGGLFTGFIPPDAAELAAAFGLGTAAYEDVGAFDAAGAAAAAVAAHVALSDPHAQYLTETAAAGAYDPLGTAGAAVAAHEADGDPHPGYLLESDATTGYLPTGTVTAGQHVLLEQHTASGSAALSFTAWYSADYDEYMIEMVNLLPATNTVKLLLRWSTNGGSSYDSGANYDDTAHASSLSGINSSRHTATTSHPFHLYDNDAPVSNSGTHGGVCGTFKLFSPAGSIYKHVTGQTNYWCTTAAGMINAYGGFLYLSTTAVNAFQITSSSGNIASGTVRIYGVRK